MQVFADQINEMLKQNISGVVKSGFFGQWTNVSDDFFHIFRSPEVRNLSGVEDIVDIFKERFFDDLGVTEEENDWGVFGSSSLKELFEIFLPGLFLIVFSDFDGEYVLLPGVRSQLGKRLTTRASDSDKQGVSSGLPEHSTKSGQMHYRISEKD